MKVSGVANASRYGTAPSGENSESNLANTTWRLYQVASQKDVKEHTLNRSTNLQDHPIEVK